jgi:hypothetical protein
MRRALQGTVMALALALTASCELVAGTSDRVWVPGSAGAGGQGVGHGGAGGEGPDCNPDDIADDFEDGVLGAQWTPPVDYLAPLPAETGGALVMTAANDGDTWRWVQTDCFYDLTNRRVAIEVRSLPTDDPSTTFCLLLEREEARGVLMGYHGGMLQNVDLTDANTLNALNSVPYAPSFHRWWAISRRIDGALVFETSSDGVAFDEVFAAYEEPAQARHRVVLATYRPSDASPTQGGTWSVESIQCNATER